jgi:nucleotide-binding universal stress UspA family protein
MFKQILVAIDGSETSSRALAVAVRLAEEQGASLNVLHVVDDMGVIEGVDAKSYFSPRYVDRLLADLRKSGRDILDFALALGRKEGITAKPIMIETRGASVAQTILAQASRVHADLLVLGTHGRRGLRRLVMGSDAEAVLREARVPVLLVRADEGDAGGKRAERRGRKSAATVKATGSKALAKAPSPQSARGRGPRTRTRRSQPRPRRAPGRSRAQRRGASARHSRRAASEMFRPRTPASPARRLSRCPRRARGAARHRRARMLRRMS